jgi:menaquinol-cytochrome c reductase iron-sulfur subunit
MQKRPDTITVPGGKTLDRRRFLSLLTVGLGGLTTAALGAPFLGFILAPLRGRPAEYWFDLGEVEQYSVGRIERVTFPDGASLPWSGRTGEEGAWLQRRGEADFVAYSLYCTHLGCPVLWKPEAHLFMCPCHGGTFHADGSVGSGPPERPLEQFPVRVQNGHVQIRTRGVEIGSG